MLTDGKVYHWFADGRIPDGLRGPSTADLTELLWEELVDAYLMVRPVDQVVGGHQHQSAVIAPAVFVGPFPTGGAKPHLLTIDMQVSHGDIELAVRCPVDMRVADTSLFCDGIARNDRFAVIHGRKRVAVIADGHKQRMRWIVEIREKIGAHILFGERFLFLGFCLSGKGQK